MIKNLRISVVSDIHLGSRENPTQHIIHNLETAFLKDEEFSKIDLLVFAGDVFDRLLDLDNVGIHPIDVFFATLFRRCVKHNVIIRFLKGTPSHDRDQIDRLVTLAKILEVDGLNFEYFNTIDVEHIEALGIDVLYVPDEAMPTTEQTLACVKDVLKAKGLSQVDFAIMHGQFEYQIPEHIKKIPRHNSKAYLDIVREFIFIGHDHTHTRFERIVAQGSFDRLTHGQEEPKGHVVAVIEKDYKEVFFIENKNAREYVTFDCTGKSLEDTLVLVKNKIEPLKENASVRVKAEKTHPIFANMDSLRRLAPTLVWSKLQKEPKVEALENSEIEEDYQPVLITKQNIVLLMNDRLRESLSDPKKHDLAMELLGECI